MNKKRILSMFLATAGLISGGCSSVSRYPLNQEINTPEISVDSQSVEASFETVSKTGLFRIDGTNFVCSENINSFDIGIQEFQIQAKNTDLIILGDTSHINPEIKQFVADKQVLSRMKLSGVEEILLEIPLELQWIVDNYYSNRDREELSSTFRREISLARYKGMTDEDYELSYKSFIDLIENSNSRDIGIKVTFIDSSSSVSPKINEEQSNMLFDIWTIAKETRSENSQEVMPFLNRKQAKFLNWYDKEFEKLRMNDVGLAKRVKDVVLKNSSNRKKTVILYGASHITRSNRKGLDEQLNKLGVNYRAIELHKSIIEYNHHIEELKQYPYSNSFDSAFLVLDGCANPDLLHEGKNRIPIKLL